MPDPRTAAAVAANQHNAAVRALEDPSKVDRAVRIVRVALERGRLTLNDVFRGAYAPVETRNGADGGERPC